MADIRELTSLADYDEFVGSAGLNVLKIGADWCVQCKFLESTLHGLSPDEISSVLLAEANADEEWFEDKVDELGVRGLPVLIAFRDGSEVGRLVGNQPKSAIIEFIGGV